MAARVLSFNSRKEGSQARIGARWENDELAECYRVVELLGRNGLPVGMETGVSDEGEPWVVFVREDTQDVIIHLARIDGRFMASSVASPVTLYGRSLRDILQEVLRTQPLVLPRLPDIAEGGTLLLHPLAVLAAFIATAFVFVSQSAPALAGENAEVVDVESGFATLPTDLFVFGAGDPALVSELGPQGQSSGEAGGTNETETGRRVEITGHLLRSSLSGVPGDQFARGPAMSEYHGLAAQIVAAVGATVTALLLTIQPTDNESVRTLTDAAAEAPLAGDAAAIIDDEAFSTATMRMPGDTALALDIDSSFMGTAETDAITVNAAMQDVTIDPFAAPTVLFASIAQQKIDARADDVLAASRPTLGTNTLLDKTGQISIFSIDAGSVETRASQDGQRSGEPVGIAKAEASNGSTAPQPVNSNGADGVLLSAANPAVALDRIAIHRDIEGPVAGNAGSVEAGLVATWLASAHTGLYRAGFSFLSAIQGLESAEKPASGTVEFKSAEIEARFDSIASFAIAEHAIVAKADGTENVTLPPVGSDVVQAMFRIVEFALRDESALTLRASESSYLQALIETTPILAHVERVLVFSGNAAAESAFMLMPGVAMVSQALLPGWVFSGEIKSASPAYGESVLMANAEMVQLVGVVSLAG